MKPSTKSRAFGLSSASRSQNRTHVPRILQLCFVNNLWPVNFKVKSIDIKTGSNVLDLHTGYGKKFDFIVAAPPCTQFTKANNLNWLKHPHEFIAIAQKCLEICIASGRPWVLENPPGRIEYFIPALKRFRIITWHGQLTNKEYVVYSNILGLHNPCKRYGCPGSVNNLTKEQREAWQPDFHEFVKKLFNV